VVSTTEGPNGFVVRARLADASRGRLAEFEVDEATQQEHRAAEAAADVANP
jgi:hypothetical protein